MKRSSPTRNQEYNSLAMDEEDPSGKSAFVCFIMCEFANFLSNTSYVISLSFHRIVISRIFQGTLLQCLWTRGLLLIRPLQQIMI